MSLEKIGFVGLGNMGGPMAKRLAAAGYQVRGFDRNETALGECVAAGVEAAESATDAAVGCDVLLTSLPRPDHVISVMRDGGALAAMGPGSLWVDLTTNRKELVAELAAEAPKV